MDTLDGMRAFVAVVETGSFTRAGKRLNMSNKLVSKYVRQLEEQTGANLLYRTTRHLSLTSMGKRYLSGCRRVLREMDQLELSLSPSAELKGLIRVTAPPTLGEMMIAGVAVDFMEIHPDVCIEIDVSAGYANLTAGGYDLAIRFGELQDSSLIARKLTTTEQLVVATPGYLERYGEPREPADLTEHNCVCDLNHPNNMRWPFTVDGKRVEISINGAYSANSAPACLVPVFAHKAIALCPGVFVSSAIRTGHLQQILANYPAWSVDIHALQPMTLFRKPLVSAFVDAIKKRMVEEAL